MEDNPSKSSPALVRSKVPIESDNEDDNHHDDFPGLHSEDEHKVISPSEAKINKKDSEPLTKIGAQARMSSEARYTRFSEYVLRKISTQVLRCAKKGLWKTEIFLAESHWSRDPENQRRLLVSLGKQELSARVFPHHNKKVRILVWWSTEPPIMFPTPFVSKNEPNNEANSNMLDDKGNLNVQKPRPVIKKKDIALDEDSSSSSASVIETDFKHHKKYEKKKKNDEKKRIKKQKKIQKKKEKTARKQQKKQETGESESDSSDFSLDLTDSDEEKEPKKSKNAKKTEKKRVDSDEDIPLSKQKLNSKSHKGKKRQSEEVDDSKDTDLSDSEKQSQKGY